LWKASHAHYNDGSSDEEEEVEKEICEFKLCVVILFPEVNTPSANTVQFYKGWWWFYNVSTPVL
jgi:hypothetical protein